VVVAEGARVVVVVDDITSMRFAVEAAELSLGRWPTPCIYPREQAVEGVEERQAGAGAEQAGVNGSSGGRATS
jgi:hypothetical protein